MMPSQELPADRWAREQAVFHQARALPPEAREAFLDRACAGDAPLRGGVLALLAADASAGGLPREPPGPAGLRPGDRVGQYLVGEPLGSGGMGVVHAAHDTRLDRPVALKTLRAWAGLDPAMRQRLDREAAMTARLQHPYACQVFDVLEHGGLPVLVLERLEGESLATVLEEEGPLPAAEAAALVREAAEALAEAHRLGILHRDLKPSNLFRTRSGHAKVLDFGIARPLAGGGPDADSLTASGVAIGTPAYCSPEQAAGEPLDARSDIFALGIVLCELISGVNPYQPSGARPALRQLFAASAPDVQALLPSAPAELVALLQRMLAPDRAARPASMREVVQALAALAHPPGGPAALPAALPPIRYAYSGDVAIAYQVFGAGPVDIVYVPGWITHLETGWTDPRVAGFFRGLGRLGRVLLFDKRGTGMSDRTVGYPTLEDRMDDVRAVMDAAGSERAVIVGMSEGGNMSMTFAASHPERVRGLITFGVFARRIWSPDYPWAPTPEARAEWYAALERDWGGPAELETLAPSLAHDPAFRDWWARYLRSGASPSAALDLARFNTQIDVREVLGSIRVPTLVIQRTGDRDVRIEEARWIAERIAGARLVELPGEDHIIYAGDQAPLLEAIGEFTARLGDAELPNDQLLTAAAIRGPEALEALEAICEAQARHFRGEPLRWREGSWMALFDGPARAIRFALTTLAVAQGRGLTLAAGVHAGTCQRRPTAVTGPAIDEAGRLAQTAAPGTLLVSETVRALVPGAGITFTAAHEAWTARLGA